MKPLPRNWAITVEYLQGATAKAIGERYKLSSSRIHSICYTIARKAGYELNREPDNVLRIIRKIYGWHYKREKYWRLETERYESIDTPESYYYFGENKSAWLEQFAVMIKIGHWPREMVSQTLKVISA